MGVCGSLERERKWVRSRVGVSLNTSKSTLLRTLSLSISGSLVFEPHNRLRIQVRTCITVSNTRPLERLDSA